MIELLLLCLRPCLRGLRHLLSWIKSIMAPTLLPSQHAGLGTVGNRWETIVSFLVAWLITFRIAGVTVGSAAAPLLAVLGSGFWYAAAVLVGWLLILTVNPGDCRRRVFRLVLRPLAALALLASVSVLVIILTGTVSRTLLDSTTVDAGDGPREILLKFLAGLLIIGVTLGGLVALVVALVATLWYGVQNQFRAAEVHPFLPAIVDITIALMLLFTAAIQLVRSGSVESLLIDSASASVLLVFAGIDLILLTASAHDDRA